MLQDFKALVLEVCTSMGAEDACRNVHGETCSSCFAGHLQGQARHSFVVFELRFSPFRTPAKSFYKLDMQISCQQPHHIPSDLSKVSFLFVDRLTHGELTALRVSGLQPHGGCQTRAGGS